MAISRVAAYAHLSEADVEAFGRELDAIRGEIEDSLGAPKLRVKLLQRPFQAR